LASHDANEALAQAIEEVDLRGNLLDGRRICDLGKRFGPSAIGFLTRAVREGSPAVMSAALETMARVAPEQVREHALAALRAPAQAAEVRAAAAEALTGFHDGTVLDALIQAASDGPLVSAAAIASLRQHASAEATSRIRNHLSSLLEALARPAGEDERLLARKARAVFGPDGSSGLLRLVAAHSYSAIEDDLFAWWRSHPDAGVKAAAARELLEGGLDNACAVLSEGLPGANEGQPKPPAGELDNGPVRLVLAEAAFVVLLGNPSEAFERLSPFFDDLELEGWFGSKRAEIILLLLLGQIGRNETSWLRGQADALHRKACRPDARWRQLRFGPHVPPELASLADQLRSWHPAG